MIAELASPEWRKILKKFKLLDKVIQAVQRILNSLFNKDYVKENSSVEDNLLNALYTLIDKFDYNLFVKSN